MSLCTITLLQCDLQSLTRHSSQKQELKNSAPKAFEPCKNWKHEIQRQGTAEV